LSLQLVAYIVEEQPVEPVGQAIH